MMIELDQLAAIAQQFAGRSHFLCGEKGWEEVADYIAGWLEKI